jgi:uncharacterized damage-inducible protein DinB
MIGANYTDQQETVAMSDAERFKTLFNYHWHTTGRLMDGAAALGVGDYLDNPGYGHGSVHGLLFHLLQTMRSWRVGLVSGRQQSGIDPAGYPDLPSLRAGLAEEQAAWDALLAGWRDEDIAADVELISYRGDALTIPRWRVLQHLVLHGMQHHSELAALLTAKGQSPGGLDFIFFRG